MKEYDVIVIGSGCGMIVVNEALSNGKKVALIDKGPFGGTCLNVGCIPSKMLIYPADVIAAIQEAAKLGIDARIERVDFQTIMDRMRRSISETRREIREGIEVLEGLDFYESEAHFVDKYTVQAGTEVIKGNQIFIAAGSRPFIPPIEGLDSINYLTNESLLRLEEKPESIVIIGGGYIAVEYGHFFAAMGTKVTIVEMADRLLLAEEPEISETLRRELGKRIDIHLNSTARKVHRNKDKIIVTAISNETEEETNFTADALLMAVGRRSNADLLKPENAGIELDKRGYIKVDEYLRTTRENIYAIGDINGQMMFTHVANAEAELAARNAFSDERIKIDYRAAPHAVYSHPQIASVGITEEQANKGHKIIVGHAMYADTAKGEAMMDETGFAKVIVDEDTLEILGFHIIGPEAPILIQEVVNAMATGTHLDALIEGIHIHPALSELIQTTIDYLEEPLEGNAHHHMSGAE